VRFAILLDGGWVLKRLGRHLDRAPDAQDVRSDLALNMEHKGVDLRVGLDIARLALGRIVDVIVVATGDSDFIPAFKFARREGVRVYLDTLEGQVNDELIVHTDLLLRTAVPRDPPAELRCPPRARLSDRRPATQSSAGSD
jgi:hypothetical protein